MFALDVPPQAAGSIEARVTAVGVADKGGYTHVGDADVALQSLVLAEAEATAVVAAAAEALGALVNGGVAAQARGGDERLAAALLPARVLLLVGIRALDILGQVLLLQVDLVAVRVRALMGAVVGVRAQVGGQTDGTVEGLDATRVYTRDGLEVRREVTAASPRVRRHYLG